MNGGAVITAAKDLGERFRLIDLLPTAILGLFVLCLLWSGAPGRSPDLDKIATRAEHLSGWEGILLAVTLMAAALILEPLQITLVRLLEGYWGQSLPGRLLAFPGQAFHRWRRRRLDTFQQRRGSDPGIAASRREEAARKLTVYRRGHLAHQTGERVAGRGTQGRIPLRPGSRHNMAEAVPGPRRPNHSRAG